MYRIKKVIKYLLLKIKLKKIKGVKIKSTNISNDIKLEEYVQISPKVNISSSVQIGKATYISPYTTIDSNVKIGRYCSIAPNVFIAPGEHYSTFITTHPILFDSVWRKKISVHEKNESVNIIGRLNESTIIGNDVWIGLNAIIMRGIKIGDGAIVGAGAIVTKDVEPYSIVAGVPAKFIKYRFNKNEIEELSKLEKWWNLPMDKLEKRLKDMYNINKYIDKYGQEKNEN